MSSNHEWTGGLGAKTKLEISKVKHNVDAIRTL